MPAPKQAGWRFPSVDGSKSERSEVFQKTQCGGKVGSTRSVTAEFAFKLYDTYGFPLDLTELMARERGLTVDVAGFNKLMDEQKARARAAQKKQVIELSQVETTTPTQFVGYDKLEAPAKVLEVVGVKDKTAVILDSSPLYAEMGGQVGDTGETERGSELWRIANTQKAGDAWLHFLASEIQRSRKLNAEAPPSGPSHAHGGSPPPRGHPAPSHRHAPAALGACTRSSARTLRRRAPMSGRRS